MKLKKLIPYLLSAALSNNIYGTYQPAENIKYQITSNNIIYSAQVYRDDNNQNKKTWRITSENEVIGDEHHEKDLFQQLAYTAAIARHTHLSPNLGNQLYQQQRNLEKLIRIYNATVFAGKAIDYSSQAEGMLLPLIATGSIGSKSVTQIDNIKGIAQKVAMRYVTSLAADIYINDPKVTEAELAVQLKKSAKDKALSQIDLAARKIKKARDVLSRNNSTWNSREANEFYTNWKSGLVYGLAYAKILSEIEHVNWDNLSKRISINFLQGIGIPKGVLTKIPGVHRYLTKVGLKNIEDSLSKEILKSNEIFSPLESFFNNVQLPLNEFPKKKGDILEFNSEKSKRSKMITYRLLDPKINRGENKCFDMVVINQGDEKYKSLEILIDDIEDPAGRRRSQQRIGLEASKGTDTTKWNGLFEQGIYQKIIDAICAQTYQSTIPGKYGIEYHFKFENENDRKLQSEKFRRTITVK